VHTPYDLTLVFANRTQVDRERHWDEYIWLRALFMVAFKALDSFEWCVACPNSSAAFHVCARAE
jgi:hypothetical protein